MTTPALDKPTSPPAPPGAALHGRALSAAALAALVSAAALLAGCGSPETHEQRRANDLIEQLRAHDAAVRRAAAGELGRMRWRPAVEPLIRTLYDIRQDVRLVALVALGEIGDGRAVDPLIGALRSEGWALRKAAAEALGKVADVRCVGPLLAVLDDPDRSVAMAAAGAMAKIGPPALPPLLEALADDGPRTREAAARGLGLLGDARAAGRLRDALADEQGLVRLAAADALCRLGERMQAAGSPAPPAEIAASIDAITQLLKDPDRPIRAEAGKSLARLGPWATPALAKAARDGDPAVRLAAVKVLGEIHDPAGIVPLLAALNDRHARVAAAAGDVFFGEDGRLRRADERIEALVAAAKHADGGIRYQAVRLLSGAGASSRAEPRGLPAGKSDLVLTAMVGRLEDPSPRVREAAVEALGMLADKRALDPMAALLNDPEPPVRLAAGRVMASMGDGRGVDAMVQLLKNPPTRDPRGARARGGPPVVQAVEALGRSGDRRAVEPLCDLTRRLHQVREATFANRGLTDEQAAFSARYAGIALNREHGLAYLVGALGRLADNRAFDVLKDMLESPAYRDWRERIIRRDTILAVAAAGGKRAYEPLMQEWTRKGWKEEAVVGALLSAFGIAGDARATDVLVDSLKWDVKEYRYAAAGSLKRIGAAAVAPMIARLDDPDKNIRTAVAIVLSRLGRAAMGPLVAALKAGSPPARQSGAWALGEAGDAQAVDPLIALLGDTEPEVRGGAAWALARLRETSAQRGSPGGLAALRRAVGPLTAMLKDPAPKARRAAADALGRLGFPEALDGLIEMLQDPDPLTCAAAATALGAIGDKRALGPLEALFRSDRSVVTRAAARDAVVGISEAAAQRLFSQAPRACRATP